MAGRMSGGIRFPIAATWNNKALLQADKQIQSFSRGVTKSFAGIGATIGGALAIGAIADSLKTMASNAMEDQASMKILGKTLDNLGFASSQTQIEAFIKSLSLATGEADDALRPALDRLIRSTGSVSEAERALVIAQDAAVSSGRSTLDVAMLLGKAYDGNTMALARAGFGIDSAILKTKDMAKITGELARITGGQAKDAAETYSGKLERINTAANEASETIGYALLNALDSVSGALGGVDGTTGTITDLGDAVGQFIDGITVLINKMNGLIDKNDETTQSVVNAKGQYVDWVDIIVSSDDPLTAVGNVIWALGHNADLSKDPVKDAGQALAAYGDKAAEAAPKFDDFMDSVGGSQHVVDGLRSAMETAGSEAANATSQVDKLKAAFDRLNGVNRTVIGAKLNMRELKANGPTATGERKGKDGKTVRFVTRDDRLRYALELAQGSEDLAAAYFAKNTDKGRALGRQALAAGRKNITGLGIRPGLAGDILSTPRNAANPLGYFAGKDAAAAVATSATTIYNFYGGINAQTPEAAIVIAKKAARLSKLSGRHVNAGLG